MFHYACGVLISVHLDVVTINVQMVALVQNVQVAQVAVTQRVHQHVHYVQAF